MIDKLDNSKWSDGLCREFAQNVESIISLHQNNQEIDFGHLGHDIVKLYHEFFGAE